MVCSRSESSRTAGDDKCVDSFSSEPTSLICSRPPFECEDLSWSAISDSLPEPGDPSAAAASCKMSLLFSALAKAARVAPTVSSASPGGDAPETPGAPELAAPVSPCPRAQAPSSRLGETKPLATPQALYQNEHHTAAQAARHTEAPKGQTGDEGSTRREHQHDDGAARTQQPMHNNTRRKGYPQLLGLGSKKKAGDLTSDG